MAALFNTSNGQVGGKKILVAWYSWGGNTQAVGKFIQEATGADIFVIEPLEPYSPDYRTCTEEAKVEINAGRSRAIKGGVDNIGQYDIIILGAPNWWSTMAPPVLEFLRRHELSGKTVAPFVTHGGGRQARCVSDMGKAAPGANILKEFVVSGNRAGGSKADVEKWLQEIGILP
ncbi:MAG: NAD(P)H-dependent oxidoreductase [Alistipes sp.]|nr:NAD(P)H-dependent oxidoreductase [Alistipes sp.]